MIHYKDAIYGEITINEPVLIDIIESNAFRRLKGVCQHGISALLGITSDFSRYDHSLGVMMLVRRFGGSLETQVAALLHDISHTAFSHVIDYVFDEGEDKSYHEKIKPHVVAASDIPEIFSRYGIDQQRVMNEDNFPLLEKALPYLCADRVDYFLRDLEFLGLAGAGEVQGALNTLLVVDGMLAVNSIDAARWFAHTFIAADHGSWSDFREVGLYKVTAEAIRAAWDLGLIDEEDLMEDDRELWEKLSNFDHKKVRKWYRLISPGTRFIPCEDDPVFKVSTKIRSIDPPVFHEGRLINLSSLDSDFKIFREKYHLQKKGRWSMKVVSAPSPH